MDEQKTAALLKAKIPGAATGIIVKPAICGLCGGKCLLDIYCKDGKVVKVDANTTLPYTNGRICVKGAALRQWLYHPERLLYPMKRVGKRGEGKFLRISWEEALAEIAAKLGESRERYGARSTLVYAGHPKWFRPQLTEFINGYGTPNFGTESSTCAYSLMMAAQSCFGSNVRMPPPDIRRCKTLIAWGVNPLYSNSAVASKPYLDAVQRGAKVIAVDPRCTPTTEHAAIHLRPLPGTDGALALGMARVIITEGLHDSAFIEQYTYGFEEYRDYVMEFTPERVEELTGVPQAHMIAAARLFATEKPSSIQMSASPVVHNINGMQNARAILLLCALTGNFGVPGGVVAPGQARAALKGAFMGEWRQRTYAEQDISHGQFPAWAKLAAQEAQVSRLADYLEGRGDYPIHMLLAFGMNHHMWPRPDRIETALDKLDLFVNMDIFMNDTCKYADILLPAASSLEREQIEVLGSDTVYFQPRVIEPLGEARNDIEVILELAKKLGFSIGNPAMHSYEDYLRSMLVPTGLNLEELQAHPDGLKTRQELPVRTTEQILQVKTPSGKIEFVSQVMASCAEHPGHDALPVYRDYRDKLPLDQYPLILSTGCRKPQLFHSRTYRVPWLSGLEPVDVVDIHPRDAAALDLHDGDPVTLRTPVGALDLHVNLDSSCLPGVVFVYHGVEDRDINLLLDDEYLDPVSGFPGYKSYCCRLEKRRECLSNA